MAHVDTPKGDLDSSTGPLSGPDVTVVKNDIVYPYGTTEQYPQIVDMSGNVLSNSAHEYTECSSRGYCDRKHGVCRCFEGYGGSSCNRMSCPKTIVGAEEPVECSGRGVCETAKNLAAADFDNLYLLWDADVTMGCKCDHGFYGAACENRMCKVGYDPIYQDIHSSARYSNWSYVIYTRSQTAMISGNYSLVFYDYTGEDWHTEPIDADARCSTITKALESIPNNVIPANSVLCMQWLDYNTIAEGDEPIKFTPNPYYGVKTTLAFPKNPGDLRQLEIDMYLDGVRPTLFSDETKSTLGTFIYPDGFSGEFVEYFTNECVGVDATIERLDLTESGLAGDQEGSTYYYLAGLTPVEVRLLARCLGDVDGLDETFSASGRVQGKDYNWDYGDKFHPHVVRMVDLTESAVTDLCLGNLDSVRGAGIACLYDSFRQKYIVQEEANELNPVSPRPPGFIVALYFDPDDELFKLFTNAGKDYDSLTTFSIFATDGVATMVSDNAQAFTSLSSPYSKSVYTRNSTGNYTGYDGSVACEINLPNENGALDCVEKGDTVFFMDPSQNERSASTNSEYLNLYSATKLSRRAPHGLGAAKVSADVRSMQIDIQHFIHLDKSINNEWTLSDSARVYTLRVPEERTVAYVSQCSNRGLCDTTSGICDCFPGFALDDCSSQNNIIS